MSELVKKVNVGLFVVGLLVLAVAVAEISGPDNSSPLVQSSLTERDIAIQEALRKGEKEYSYTTNFIPGVGRIGDPDAYLEQLQQQAE